MTVSLGKRCGEDSGALPVSQGAGDSANYSQQQSDSGEAARPRLRSSGGWAAEARFPSRVAAFRSSRSAPGGELVPRGEALPVSAVLMYTIRAAQPPVNTLLSGSTFQGLKDFLWTGQKGEGQASSCRTPSILRCADRKHSQGCREKQGEERKV